MNKGRFILQIDYTGDGLMPKQLADYFSGIEKLVGNDDVQIKLEHGSLKAIFISTAVIVTSLSLCFVVSNICDLDNEKIDGLNKIGQALKETNIIVAKFSLTGDTFQIIDRKGLRDAVETEQAKRFLTPEDGNNDNNDNSVKKFMTGKFDISFVNDRRGRYYFKYKDHELVITEGYDKLDKILNDRGIGNFDGYKIEVNGEMEPITNQHGNSRIELKIHQDIGDENITKDGLF